MLTDANDVMASMGVSRFTLFEDVIVGQANHAGKREILVGQEEHAKY